MVQQNEIHDKIIRIVNTSVNKRCMVSRQSLSYGLTFLAKYVFFTHATKTGAIVGIVPNEDYRTGQIIHIGDERYIWRFMRPVIMEVSTDTMTHEMYMNKLSFGIWAVVQKALYIELYEQSQRRSRRINSKNMLENIYSDTSSFTFYNITARARQYTFYERKKNGALRVRVIHEFLFAYLTKID